MVSRLEQPTTMKSDQRIAAGNVNNSFNIFTTLSDTKAPLISNVNADINASSATISRNTDVVSDNGIRYSINPDLCLLN